MLAWPADAGDNGPSSILPANIALAVTNAADSGWIATFGEFDQNGFTVQQAIDGWVAIVTDPNVGAHPEIKLISPYAVTLANLQSFMTGITSLGVRLPDAIALDGYSGNLTDPMQSVGIVQNRVRSWHAAFPTYPLWYMEYAINAVGTPSDTVVTTFMHDIAEWFNLQAYVLGHFWWFMGPPSFAHGQFSARNQVLYDESAVVTGIGNYWKSLPY
jgi:hypothetical protein